MSAVAYLLWCALHTAPNGATLLEKAEAEYTGLHYLAADKTLQQLEKTQGLSHEQAVRALALASRVKAALGHADEARAGFTRLLEIAPDYKLEGRASPKITGPFFEAKGSARPIALAFEPARVNGRWALLKVTLTGPLTRIKTVRVRLTEDGLAREVLPEVEHELNLRLTADELTVDAQLEDERGWVLCEFTQTFAALPKPEPVPAPPPRPADAPVAASPPARLVPSTPSVVARAPPIHRPTPSPRFRPGAWTSIAFAIVGAVTGFVFFAIASFASSGLDNAKAEALGGPLPITRAQAQMDDNLVHDCGTAAYITWGISAVLLGGGIAVLIAGNPPSEPDEIPTAVPVGASR